LSRSNILGWVLMIAGFVLWLYGYWATGHAALIDWASLVPNWIADFVPNVEAEAGLGIMIVAMIPAYWPKH
jgi:hypothetical protein